MTFQLEEIIGEKIRASMQRNKPRNYLDLYYILGKGDFDLKKAVEIAKQKVKTTGDKFGIEKIFINLDVVKSLWNQDLTGLLVDIPDFDRVITRVKNKLAINFA